MRKLFISFIALWSLCFHGSSYGATSGDQYFYGSYVGGSAQQVCTAFASAQTMGGNKFIGTIIGVQVPGWLCEVKYSSGTWYTNIQVNKRVINCSGQEVYGEDTGTCAPPAGPKCNTPAGQEVPFTAYRGSAASYSSENSDPGTVPPYPTTSPTCGLSGVPDVTDCYAVKTPSGGANHFCTYSGKSNGKDADPSAVSPGADATKPNDAKPSKEVTPSDSKGDCPRGTVAAGRDMGGTTICMGTGTNPSGNGTSSPKDERPTTGSTTKSTDAAGNTVETQTSTRSNSDGSSTTTTTVTTTGPDGTKSVSGSTSTSTTPGGKQGVPDPDTKDFCTQHPELTACKNSTVSGSCAQISCTGDAIQCATLQQAAAMRCAQEATLKELKEDAFFSLGTSVKNGNDPLGSKLPNTGNGETIGVEAITDTGWLGTGQCFPDEAFSYRGFSFTIPFSKMCPMLVALRYAFMVYASLISFGIMRRAFFG